VEVGPTTASMALAALWEPWIETTIELFRRAAEERIH
jgi:hypothetical protein